MHKLVFAQWMHDFNNLSDTFYDLIRQVPLLIRRLNPYSWERLSFFMVEIQCPNCDVVVEFEDGVPGVFSCHNCQSNIEWGYTVKTTKRTPGGTIFFGILSILGLIAFSLVSAADSRFMADRPELVLTCCGICSIPFAIFLFFAIKEGK